MELKQHVALAEEAGFQAAVKKATADEILSRKLLQAYQDYAFIPEEKIQAFIAKLKTKTVKMTGTPGINLHHHYDTLKLEDISQYQGLPPHDVLEKVKAAKSKAIFDTFEVASITSVIEYKDSIVFGKISGCTDRFYIAEWGDDVSIADLMA